jgi:hypothetical protein
LRQALINVGHLKNVMGNVSRLPKVISEMLVDRRQSRSIGFREKFRLIGRFCG